MHRAQQKFTAAQPAGRWVIKQFRQNSSQQRFQSPSLPTLMTHNTVAKSTTAECCHSSQHCNSVMETDITPSMYGKGLAETCKALGKHGGVVDPPEVGGG